MKIMYIHDIKSLLYKWRFKMATRLLSPSQQPSPPPLLPQLSPNGETHVVIELIIDLTYRIYTCHCHFSTWIISHLIHPGMKNKYHHHYIFCLYFFSSSLTHRCIANLSTNTHHSTPDIFLMNDTRTCAWILNWMNGVGLLSLWQSRRRQDVAS